MVFTNGVMISCHCILLNYFLPIFYHVPKLFININVYIMFLFYCSLVLPTSRSHDPSPRQNYPECKSHYTLGIEVTTECSLLPVVRPTIVQDDTSSLTCTIDGECVWVCEGVYMGGYACVMCTMYLNITNCIYICMPGGTNQSAVGMTATPTNSQCSIKIMRRCVVDKLAPYWSMVCHHLGYSNAEFRQDSSKKRLIAVLEHWITTGEKERKPRTWSMFIEVLNDVNELSAISSVICSELNKAGVCTGKYIHVVHLQSSIVWSRLACLLELLQLC